MRTPAVLQNFLLVVLGALAIPAAPAQVIELRATINAAQEVPPTTSPAAGSAVMLYDVAANTYDLVVRIDVFLNTVTDTHIQEGPAGGTGPALVHAGAESVYTRTNGSTL